jgi:radical SAM superfamily enzyme YgiQ (UPF0313 family)
MPDYTHLIHQNLHHLRQPEAFLPFDNPTFANPDFDAASCRVLIARLSPFRDVDRSLPHLFLFQEVRRALPDALVDFAFFPAADARALFDQENIPYLLGSQSLRSAGDFDLLLVSNAYTLELVNLPTLLIRSGIPLFASQRGSEWPLVLLGGSNALAAQAVIREDGDSLADGIFFGEGEGLVSRLVALLTPQRSGDRRQTLERAAQEIAGFWAAGSRRRTVKATCAPDARLLPVEYPILNSPAAHTAHLQIAYGCPAFCSFCFEGYDRKPYRELPLPDLLVAARRVKQAQGVEELDLYAFNFNTHADILELLPQLHRLFERVSLKSQRADVLQRVEGMAEAEVEADKRSFTLGIEGISERQRAWLHKSLSESEIEALLDRLLRLKIRTVKLFYLLTGHEGEADVAEFRCFLRRLKETRAARNRGIRVIFSFGPLVRMPFTPLRYDRLLLDRAEWKPLIGQVKSACETNGFEFRLAFDWPAYRTSQVLALGGYWLIEPLVALAEKGYFFDTTLPPEYWDELREWMERTGRWNEAFLGEKGPDYPFALEFVESSISADFLYRQYQEAQAGKDGGYCLGDADKPGRCLGCGACADEAQRQAITHHAIRQPDAEAYLAQLRETLARKRRLKPAYFRLRLSPSLVGALPEFLNGFVFRGILAHCPDLAENLLAVRECLFSARPNDRRFPGVSGETVFALKAWDVEALLCVLGGRPASAGGGFEIVGPAEDFTPGEFARLHLDLDLPATFFPDARARLEQYLRLAYLPYSLRREGSGYRFALVPKALKKKIVFAGFLETRADGFHAGLDVGPKFDLGAFFETFEQPNLFRQARVSVSNIQW